MLLHFRIKCCGLVLVSGWPTVAQVSSLFFFVCYYIQKRIVLVLVVKRELDSEPLNVIGFPPSSPVSQVALACTRYQSFIRLQTTVSGHNDISNTVSQHMDGERGREGRTNASRVRSR